MPHVQSSKWVMFDAVKSDEGKPPPPSPHPPNPNPKPLTQPPHPKPTTPQKPTKPLKPIKYPRTGPTQDAAEKAQAGSGPQVLILARKRSVREVSGELRARIRPKSADFS